MTTGQVTVAEAIQTAIELHQRGQVEQAAVLYRAVLATVPEQVDALHFLGLAEHQCGRSVEALGLMGRAVEQAPAHPDLRNNRGNVLKALGRLDEAEADYRAALAVRPGDASALSNLGTVLRERGSLEEAERVLRKAIALQPQHVEAHLNLGNVLSAQHRLAEAAEAHREALRLQPTVTEAYRQLGMSLYAIGEIDEAANVYRKWLSMTPDDPEAAHLLAGCTGEGVPSRASDAYVRKSFDHFAESFDRALQRLEYRAPTLVGEAARVLAGERAGSLDVLDVGCGTGLCAEGLRPLARSLTGVDLSQKMLEQARARGAYDALECAELTAYLRRHTAAYDLVVSADTLVYFGALDAVMAAAASALRPGGHLVFTVERSEEAAAPEGHRIHPHGRYSHTESYLRRVLSDAGLQVLSVSPVELRKEAGQWVAGLLVSSSPCSRCR
jgi:predicted TPR repeat methyltransferase